MFVVSFRVPLGSAVGQRLFLNGSALSFRYYEKGQPILVQVKDIGHTSCEVAEVIDSHLTSREVGFRWEIVQESS